MIKAIIFDCFGVLTGDKWREFVGALPEEQREPARELNRALDRGQLTLDDFSKEIYELTGILPERVEDTINAEMHKNAALLSYIGELKKQYKIGLISNISSDWITDEFLDQDEQQLFDAIVLSHHVGVVKPDPKIYKAAINQLGVMAEECVFIDDGIGNCEGAEAVGMQAVCYDDFTAMKHELESLL